MFVNLKIFDVCLTMFTQVIDLFVLLGSIGSQRLRL